MEHGEVQRGAEPSGGHEAAAPAALVERLAAALQGPAAGLGALEHGFLPGLAAALGAERAGLYTLALGARGVLVDGLHGHNLPGGLREAINAGLARGVSGVLGFDPLLPEPGERNVALAIPPAGRRRPDAGRLLASHPELEEAHLLRLLACQGGALLGWVELHRAAPFEEEDRQALQRLAGPLRERLLAERALASGAMAYLALQAALEQVGRPAALVDGHGTVRHANGEALALLARDYAGYTLRLREALAGRAPGLRATRLDLPGAAPHHLVVEPPAATDHASRLDRLTLRWALSRRQAQVLSEVARGRSNKAAAQALSLSESTVEMHVTALLRRVGCENRAELAARFWTEA